MRDLKAAVRISNKIQIWRLHVPLLLFLELINQKYPVVQTQLNQVYISLRITYLNRKRVRS